MPVKPSDKEFEYFARKEFEKKMKIEHENRKKMEKQERKKIKESHYMHCPQRGMNLIEIDYKGIAVDKCSACEGVWLDAG